MKNIVESIRTIEGPIPWIGQFCRTLSSQIVPALTGPVVYIASDYAGTQKESEYSVVSALFCDLSASYNWELKRRMIRDKYMPDKRRMSFKGLSDKLKLKALYPFLCAANDISGVLATFIIYKKIKYLMLTDDNYKNLLKSIKLSAKWTFIEFERMFRAAHLVSTLIGTLGKDGQDIYWISDEDQMFANSKKQADVTTVMSHLSNVYIQFKPGKLGIGTTAIDSGNLIEEDLSAIADLTAGAYADIMTTHFKSGHSLLKESVFPWGIKDKTKTIGNWIAEDSKTLKKIAVVIEPCENGTIRSCILNLKPGHILLF